MVDFEYLRLDLLQSWASSPFFLPVFWFSQKSCQSGVLRGHHTIQMCEIRTRSMILQHTHIHINANETTYAHTHTGSDLPCTNLGSPVLRAYLRVASWAIRCRRRRMKSSAKWSPSASFAKWDDDIKARSRVFLSWIVASIRDRKLHLWRLIENKPESARVCTGARK